jgi:hypothetical protein
VTDGLIARGQHDAETLLAIWEQGLGHAPSLRAEAMLQRLNPAAAPRTLGVRNRRLIDLHARLFGDELELSSHCPACSATVQFSSLCCALISDSKDERSTPTEHIEIAPYAIEFRLPDRSDVTVAASDGDGEEFARRLLYRCVVSATRDGAGIAAGDLPDDALDALSRRIESLDPLALVSFSLECPECRTCWDAPLDLDQLLWTKVQAAAERLLLDVDALARTYGWTERDVLALTPSRRAAYLQLAGA